MWDDKSIIAKYFNYYLLVVFSLFIILFTHKGFPVVGILNIIFLFILILPVTFVIFKSKYRKPAFLSLIYIVSESFLMFIFFRKIREFFPLKAISEDKIVGYSQYFGYPFNFDTFIFITFLLSPIVIFVLFKFTKK